MASDTNSTIPAPIVFDTSQEFDGNDGKWSTFVVRIGTPEQNFRVLPALSTGETIVPTPAGCVQNRERQDPPNCGALRGAYPYQGVRSNGFQNNESTTWSNIGLYDTYLGDEFGSEVGGLYGLDNLALMVQGSGGPTLSKQVIAGMAAPDFWIGVFGLSPKPSNFSEFNFPQRSPLRTLKDDRKIPSLSYAYTAGANYKSPKVVGSLTLGGYDQSRLKPHNITFPMDPDDSVPLSVHIQRISVSNGLHGEVSVLEDATYVRIDSTVPHLWLPRKVCDRIEYEFQLQYDNNTDLYRVNDTIHRELFQRNPTMTISLGEALDPNGMVNVVLPYSAFDLQAEHPIYPNATNYFPIRRGSNETQYTLGRAFLQEAYLIADFERGNFSVHQALFPPTTAQKEIVPILTPSDATKIDVSNQPEENSPQPTLGKAAMIGISVGAAIFVILLITLIYLLLIRRSRSTGKPIICWFYRPKESELQDHEKARVEILSGTRHEMYQPELGEMDGFAKAELEYKHKAPPQEMFQQPTEMHAEVPSPEERESYRRQTFMSELVPDHARDEESPGNGPGREPLVSAL